MHIRTPEYWRPNLLVCLLGSFSTAFAMTLILPFLPLYVEQLGIHGQAAVTQWSGLTYSATFVTAGLLAPLWGRLGDRFGRKAMLIRASLGMAISVALMGIAMNIWQFLGLRLLAGLAGGYTSGSMILIAVQVPQEKSGMAMGILSSGSMAGNLIGPLLGGWLAQYISIQHIFLYAGALIFISFLLTIFFIKENTQQYRNDAAVISKYKYNKSIVNCMFATGFLLMFANFSIQPILTIYITNMGNAENNIAFIAGVAISATAIGSILSASYLGKLADTFGHINIIIYSLLVSAVFILLQAFSDTAYQLIALRFLMGIALGGLLPCLSAMIKAYVAERILGKVMGYSLSAQFIGQFLGPLTGGMIGGQWGIRAVFFVTAFLLLLGTVYNVLIKWKNAV